MAGTKKTASKIQRSKQQLCLDSRVATEGKSLSIKSYVYCSYDLITFHRHLENAGRKVAFYVTDQFASSSNSQGQLIFRFLKWLVPMRVKYL